MASLFNQYRKKRKELTPEIIDELTDRMELMNAEKINKISMSTQAQKQKLEEKNIIDVEIEKETYNIVIAKRAKALMRKQEIPQKIMNNSEIMESKKAGFIFNPLQSVNHSVKPKEESNNQSVNRTVKPNQEKEQPKESHNQTVNRTVITEPLTDRLESSHFTKEELKLITILWDNSNVKTNDSLVTRKEVLKVIGDTKVNTTLLRDLYKKLIGLDYIYKRVGYFAKVEL